jgi:hypothetical protein
LNPNIEKIKESHAALYAFFDSLGPNDIYKQVLLEEFFKILLENKNALLLLDSPGQERCQTPDHLQEQSKQNNQN